MREGGYTGRSRFARHVSRFARVVDRAPQVAVVYIPMLIVGLRNMIPLYMDTENLFFLCTLIGYFLFIDKSDIEEKTAILSYLSSWLAAEPTRGGRGRHFILLSTGGEGLLLSSHWTAPSPRRIASIGTCSQSFLRHMRARVLLKWRGLSTFYI